MSLKRPAAAAGGDKEGSDDETDEDIRALTPRNPRAKPKAAKSAPPKPPETLSQSEAAEGAEGQPEEAAEAGSAEPDVKEEAGSPSKYTPKGVVRRDYAEGNRMLAGLRAQKTGKDPEKAAKAAEALDLYGKLGWEEKESMVSRFRSRPAGGGTKWIDDWMTPLRSATTRIGAGLARCCSFSAWASETLTTQQKRRNSWPRRCAASR